MVPVDNRAYRDSRNGAAIPVLSPVILIACSVYLIEFQNTTSTHVTAEAEGKSDILNTIVEKSSKPMFQLPLLSPTSLPHTTVQKLQAPPSPTVITPR